MNNTELIRQLAERGMGWEVVENLKGGILTFYDRNKKLILGWNPLTDWNDCMGLVGEMRGKGFQFELQLGEHVNDNNARFYIFEDDGGFRYVGASRNKRVLDAICLAIAKALGIDISIK